jgi:hypothetical protein
VFARCLHLGLPRRTGSQHAGRSAVAEERRCDDVCPRQLIQPEGERTEFDRDKQHGGAGSAPRQPRGDGKARDAGRTAEPEHRHTLHVGSEPHCRSKLGIEAWGRNPRRGDRDDAIDVRSLQAGSVECLRRRFEKQAARNLAIGCHSVFPSVWLDEPAERPRGMACPNAGIAEDAGEMLEIAQPAGKQPGRRFGCFLLRDDVFGRRNGETE